MTDVVEINGQRNYIDKNLRMNLDDMKADLHKDNDVVLVIDGAERIGKSVCGIGTIGWYCSDGKLTLKDVCLTPEEFAQRVRTAQKYDVIIFDECYLGLAAADTMRSYNRILKQMLVTCGQKNLFLILILPSVFDISKYVALHRASGLVHCFKHKGKRGFFAFYNHQRLQQLYVYGKKTYSYWRPKPNFHGRFTGFYGIDESEYKVKKADSLQTLLKDMDESDSYAGKKAEQLYHAISIIKKHSCWPNKYIAEQLGCSERTVYTALAYMKKPATAEQNVNNYRTGIKEGKDGGDGDE